jgi:hypothetical protein
VQREPDHLATEELLDRWSGEDPWPGTTSEAAPEGQRQEEVLQTVRLSVLRQGHLLEVPEESRKSVLSAQEV